MLKIQSSDDGRIQITWDKPEELEEYIEKLQEAAERLTSENRRLRKQHTFICDKVRDLHNEIIYFILSFVLHFKFVAIFDIFLNKTLYAIMQVV